MATETPDVRSVSRNPENDTVGLIDAADLAARLRCRNRGFAIEPAPVLLRKNVSRAFDSASTCDSHGDRLSWRHGSQKGSTNGKFPLTYLTLGKILLRMGRKKNPHAQALGALGGKARQKICRTINSLRLAARAGRQERSDSQQHDEERSQNSLSQPANVIEHSNRRKGNTDAKSETKRTNRPHRGPLVCALLGTAQSRRIIERKRVTHQLGEVTTRGKNPPADIKQEAERHMSKVRGAVIPAERILTLGDFVREVYLLGWNSTSGPRLSRATGMFGKIT